MPLIEFVTEKEHRFQEKKAEFLEYLKKKDSVDGMRFKSDRPMLPCEEVYELVIKDLFTKAKYGFGEVGASVRPFKGRSTLLAAYDEALDQSLMLRQLIEEHAQNINDYGRLCVEWRNAMRLHNFDKAIELEAKMEEIEEKIYDPHS